MAIFTPHLILRQLYQNDINYICPGVETVVNRRDEIMDSYKSSQCFSKSAKATCLPRTQGQTRDFVSALSRRKRSAPEGGKENKKCIYCENEFASYSNYWKQDICKSINTLEKYLPIKVSEVDIQKIKNTHVCCMKKYILSHSENDMIPGSRTIKSISASYRCLLRSAPCEMNVCITCYKKIIIEIYNYYLQYLNTKTKRTRFPSPGRAIEYSYQVKSLKYIACSLVDPFDLIEYATKYSFDLFNIFHE